MLSVKLPMFAILAAARACPSSWSSKEDRITLYHNRRKIIGCMLAPASTIVYKRVAAPRAPPLRMTQATKSISYLDTASEPEAVPAPRSSILEPARDLRPASYIQTVTVPASTATAPVDDMRGGHDAKRLALDQAHQFGASLTMSLCTTTRAL